MRRLTTKLVTPLLFSLSLPARARFMSVLIEYGLLPLDRYRDTLILEYVRHVVSLPPHSPTRLLFLRSCVTEGVGRSKPGLHFVTLVAHTLYKYHIPTLALPSAAAIQRTIHERTFAAWRQCCPFPSLAHVKTRVGFSPYLTADPIRVRLVRAKLRFNRYRNGEDCALCLVPASRDHILLHCPLHEHIRCFIEPYLYIHHHSSLSMITLLGDPPSDPTLSLYISRFLVDIVRVRGF